MTTQEVADRLVALCREGKNIEAINELYHEAVHSVEPEGAPHTEVHGLDAVVAKTQGFFEMVEEMHGGEISDPLVAGDYFTCKMVMDMTMKGAGRVSMEEIALYEVAHGKIVREQFFFHPEGAPAES